jgi:hypothetical protein
VSPVTAARIGPHDRDAPPPRVCLAAVNSQPVTGTPFTDNS